ncbi:hypothetical protein PTSG_11698 [Salpingoeca rosetta]|uniref:Uncharacterized protein n=1 Tax=Salpingoeca rosetta (strain ATCC 50818 / BSB-021) TaxID=946362 RepID=F2U176_SALR5|nr:uncharacterized protein PTSG_11698 [Salpingoeca rosetta]EGD80650.1 hypothetical protein PTSG_11698 [Salpingoeca rosetta]|eukprot:XP_004997211.1 hypothetical protein PTSG_11698 [Salpingoeca rosetta]
MGVRPECSDALPLDSGGMLLATVLATPPPPRRPHSDSNGGGGGGGGGGTAGEGRQHLCLWTIVPAHDDGAVPRTRVALEAHMCVPSGVEATAIKLMAVKATTPSQDPSSTPPAVVIAVSSKEGTIFLFAYAQLSAQDQLQKDKDCSAGPSDDDLSSLQSSPPQAPRLLGTLCGVEAPVTDTAMKYMTSDASVHVVATCVDGAVLRWKFPAESLWQQAAGSRLSKPLCVEPAACMDVFPLSSSPLSSSSWSSSCGVVLCPYSTSLCFAAWASAGACELVSVAADGSVVSGVCRPSCSPLLSHACICWPRTTPGFVVGCVDGSLWLVDVTERPGHETLLFQFDVAVLAVVAVHDDTHVLALLDSGGMFLLSLASTDTKQKLGISINS